MCDASSPEVPRAELCCAASIAASCSIADSGATPLCGGKRRDSAASMAAWMISLAVALAHDSNSAASDCARSSRGKTRPPATRLSPKSPQFPPGMASASGVSACAVARHHNYEHMTQMDAYQIALGLESSASTHECHHHPPPPVRRFCQPATGENCISPTL